MSFSNNIFLSNVYEDGTPISTSKSNNSFLKKKHSTYTNTTTQGLNTSNSLVYVAPSDTHDSIEVEVEGNNIVNKVEQIEAIEPIEPIESVIETIDPIDNTNVVVSDNTISDNKNE